MEEREDYQQTPKEKYRLDTLLQLALPLYKLQGFEKTPREIKERNEYAEVIMQAFLVILPHINYTNIIYGFNVAGTYQADAYFKILEELRLLHSNPKEYRRRQRMANPEWEDYEEPLPDDDPHDDLRELYEEDLRSHEIDPRSDFGYLDDSDYTE